MEEPQNSTGTRFYCHQCEREIQGDLQDFKCPMCLNGFIEELEDSMPSPYSSNSDIDEPIFLGMFGGGAGFGTDSRQDGQGSRRRRHMASQQPLRATRRRTSSDRSASQQISPIEAIIQEFVSNLTGGGVNFEVDHDGGGSPMFLFGNPGDYAWGLGGLDTVITQLLNQMDGMGPPPMPKDRIKNLPTVQITEKHVSESLQCSVCWDDYKLTESVRQLGCEHLFHNDCIVPWLELHGTCPVCRKSFVEQSESSSDSSEQGPSTSGSSDPGSSRRSASESNAGSRRQSNGFFQNLFGSLTGLSSARGAASERNQSSSSQSSTASHSSGSASHSRDSSANRRVTRSQTRPRSDDHLDLD